MNKYIVAALLIGILIGFGVCYVCFQYLTLKEKIEFPSHVQIGAFYYVWYNSSSDGYSWAYPKICDKPILGHYNSCDPEVIAQHFIWLSDLQINFIIISYWGHYNQTPWHQLVLTVTHQIFRIARESVTNVKVCIMVEPFINKTQHTDWHHNYSEIYDFIYDNFVVPYPTVYYDHQEKPLVCFFNDEYLTPDGNLAGDNRFDVKIVGQRSYVHWIYTNLMPVESPIPRNGQIPVTPRFDDSRFRTPSYVVDKNLCEGVYDEQWKRAIDYAREGVVDVITICSWNEYPERTEIEPHWDADAHDHNPYFLYDKTKEFISTLKGETAYTDPNVYRVQTHAKEFAYAYLVSSYNPALGLCYEHPELKNTYWVMHDNVLASYVLQNWNREIADNITETVKKIAEDYNLTRSQIGFPLDCRAEILLGYDVNVFFNNTELLTLNSSYYGSVLKTEGATNEILKDFENYADLLCYASLVEWRNENYSGADYYYEKAEAMWDGYGFADDAFDTNKFYATYKLGLFYFVNRMLGKSSFEFEKDLIQRVWLCQDINGGFKTDYYGDGSFPSCYTNTETTSIILLAGFPFSQE